jgi:hypothetical protein
MGLPYKLENYKKRVKQHVFSATARHEIERYAHIDR